MKGVGVLGGGWVLGVEVRIGGLGDTVVGEAIERIEVCLGRLENLPNAPLLLLAKIHEIKR